MPEDLNSRMYENLGLQTIKAIIENQLAGKMNIISEQGTKFIFIFSKNVYKSRI
jgi:two-component sensor histidine kinase